ncbi:MAG: hypothetical protein VZR02_04950 [Lachnospiraceae bacterium]|nr:hypothetical protein [Lachnospiraceae bacterium]
MAEKKDKSAKGSIFSKQISFKGAERYPDKTVINLVRHEKERQSRRFAIFLVVFVLAFLAFVYFGVFGRMRALNEKQAEYDNLQMQLVALQQADADYADVKKEYDKATGWYLTEDEKAEVDKTGVFHMLEEDLFPYVSVTSVTMSGTDITIETGVTDLATTSTFIKTLQADARNQYVTVATTNAPSAGDSSSAVIAEIHITYAGGSGSTTSSAPSESQ